jgi:hypothetical protein
VIVWGGVSRGSTIEAVGDGAAYDPAEGSWRTIASAPSGVLGGGGRAAAWTGQVAVFWAGNSPDGPAAGGVYDPGTDAWSRLPDGPLGSREGYVSVWTGKEFLIMGGTSGDGLALPAAAAVDPVGGSWRLLPGLNQLGGLRPTDAVWNGRQVFVAGLRYECPGQGGPCTESGPIFIAYDPSTDSLDEIDLTDAPVDPEHLASLAPIGWTGSEVVLSRVDDPSAGVVFYDPSSGEWRSGAAAPCPAQEVQTAWLADRYVVPCGDERLQVYDPASNAWQLITAGPSQLNSGQGSAVVWTGTDLVAWSGAVNETGNPTPDTGGVITLGP